jgi:hypothetical protein
LARSKSKKSRRSKSKHSKKSKKKKKSTHRELPVAEEDDAEEALEDTPGSNADEEDPSKLIVAAIKDAAAEAVLKIENAKPKVAANPKGRPPAKSPARTKSPGTAAARPKGPAKSPKPVPKSTPAKSPSAKTASGRVTKAPDSYTDKK